MKITALLLLRTAGDYSSSSGPSDPVVLANASDVGHFGYFQRTAAKEFILFVARTVAKRTPPGQRQSVQHEVVTAVKMSTRCTLTIGMVSVLWHLWTIIIQSEVHFSLKQGSQSSPCCILCAFVFLLDSATFSFFTNDPAEVDKLLKIQRDLDETKILLHKTIDSVLARGEKLDSLVEKSSDLSAASQMFYKQARKTNQCCTLL
ncbi:hypothetical protein C4D60_Mb11t12820 [Musa balbisiana]|uniref:V-SNARE coiled-coil homology domain-containing protein n=1 Tax=Musa balbisiana TaxID=52838 RepID=A0A4S8J3U6_MUSBA|nr:hypothetical protein C4D60_Mb11t12820 [Musa balbisiana]